MTANPTRVHDNLTRRERQSQRADIVIKPADKGSGTVVMNRQNYLDECYRQLNDPSFYKRVNEDPTEDINKRVRFYLKRLLADEIIDKQTHRIVGRFLSRVSYLPSYVFLHSFTSRKL